MIYLKLYAVQNKDGQWFRSKGYGGYGKSWVDSLDKAKLYTKIGSARSQVTFWANNYPDFGIPKLIELQVHDLVDLKEEERVLKAMKKKQEKEAKYEIQRQKYLKEYAERKIQEGLKTLQELNKKSDEF